MPPPRARSRCRRARSFTPRSRRAAHGQPPPSVQALLPRRSGVRAMWGCVDMARFKSIRAPKTSRGFIVVAVLWIIAPLATLASMYALYVRETSAAFVGQDDRLEAQALARAGVELAVYQLTAIPDRRPVQGQFRFRMGSAEVAVQYRCESGRIDLNLGPKELFAGLFAALGARREDAAEYADRIVAWRTPPTSGAADPTADAEGSLYSAAGKAYRPPPGPFQHTEELALVLGLPQVLVDRALPHLTVYSGQAEVNLLAATPEVLAALPGVTPDWLHVLLDQRQGAPQDVLRARLGPAAR